MVTTLHMHKIEHRMQICLRNLRIACNTDHVLQYRWKNYNLNLQMGAILKNPLTILDPYTYTRPIQPNHFQADLIWCDSAFKVFLFALCIRYSIVFLFQYHSPCTVYLHKKLNLVSLCFTIDCKLRK